ncbi:MAG: peptidoglycan-binding domain-containing protein [Sedimentisphaerales bacterium]|jgi:hypothetical protein
MAKYTVKQGECIESIAFDNGFFWETVWKDSQNAELKQKRKDPNVLLAGDEVFIPDKREKTESGATEERHRFRKKGVPAMLRIRLIDDDKPRANESYTLEIDGELFSGTTDDDGTLEHPISPGAKKGRLLVGEEQDEYLLDLGYLDPVDEIAGVQGRLNNLGFHCGAVDGVLGPKTEAALTDFQKRCGLPESGKIDQATRDKLIDIYGR